MRPAEVSWRIAQRLSERRRRRDHSPSASLLPGLAEAAAALRLLASGGPTRDARFFGVSFPYPGSESIDWSRDYKNGVSAPLRFYADLDYRDEREVGDSKYTWELNRHQFLLPWALEYRKTGDETAAAAVASVVLDWIARNPRYLGINWISALEHALRILNWGIAFDLCRGSAAVERSLPFVTAAVAEKALFIRDTLSLHSSANNHLMGELIGLLAGAAYFPDAAGVSAFGRFARTEVMREAAKQNHADGVNREQAIYYHHYTTEYILTAERLCQRTGEPLGVDVQQLAHRMLAFIHAMTDDSGQPFEIGDRDDGSVTGLNLGSGVSVFESLLWTAAVHFQDGDCGAHAARIAARSGREAVPDARTAYWYPDTAPALAAGRSPRRHFFPDGGYFLSTDEGHSLLFKASPFGYPSIAAHSHCDQLSVLLRVSGQDLLTDGGTCVYHTEEKWRRYFKGTTAHNTVRVDERDQAEYAGAFLWATHAEGRLDPPREMGGSFEIVGRHDGYRRLADPVSHQRNVSWRAGVGYRIVDVLTGEKPHRFELVWNVGSAFTAHRVELPVDRVAAAWRIDGSAGPVAHVVVIAARRTGASQYHGDTERPAGFESRAYLEKTPCDQLVVSAAGDASWTAATYVVFGGELPDMRSLEGRWDS